VEWARETRSDEWYESLKDRKNTVRKFKIFDLEELLKEVRELL